MAVLLFACLVLCLGKRDNYYKDINPKEERLDLQLHSLISKKTDLSYAQIWNAFPTVYAEIDKKCEASHPPLLGDVYSTKCWEIGPGAEGGEQCGNYKNEGDCYNREHVWPVSWWGGSKSGSTHPYTDIHHIWPSDGKVNAMRGNLPFCDVDEGVTYVSTNGCKVGTCNSTGFAGRGFEVADEFKGDLARAIFYVSTAYLDTFDCCESDGVSGSAIKPWMAELLKRWHEQDPPSATEEKMNDAVYHRFQRNRNPYIDHPEWVGLVDFSAETKDHVAGVKRRIREKESSKSKKIKKSKKNKNKNKKNKNEQSSNRRPKRGTGSD
jgi:endonuclease I